MATPAKWHQHVGTLTAPMLGSVALGGVLAVAYAALTLALPEGSRVLFLGLVGATVLFAAGLGEGRLRRRLRALAGLNAALQPSRAERVAALQAVSAFPDFVFVHALEVWVIGSLAVGLLYQALGTGVVWSTVGRVVCLGLVFGPASALVTHLVTLGRARRSLAAIAQGLEPSDVVASLPARRHQLAARFIVLTALSVILPAIASADVSLTLSRTGLQRVVAATGPQAQRAAAEAVRRELALSLVGLLGVVAAFAAGVAWMGGRAVADPVRQIAEAAARIAAGGMVAPQVVPGEDEVWEVSSAFTSLQVRLEHALSELRRAGLRIGTTTEQIVATSGRHESGATQQAASLNETSATTEELARSARQIAENAASVAELASKTWASAQGAQQSADAFGEAMSRMQQDNQSISGAVTRLSLRVQQIGKIVEFINGVADKSDLLALNAELEGTKAGEVGRGFSLVAAEMRRLAENVIESTNEIEELIDEVRQATRAVVDATDAGLRATAGGMDMAESVSESLGHITEVSERTSEAVRSISVATQQQQAGTDQLAMTMGTVLKVTHQSVEATKQVAAANVDLATLARELKVVVDRFQV